MWGEPDEHAAYQAYSTVNHLIDYRTKQDANAALLGEVDRETTSTEMLSRGQVRRLIISFAQSFVDAGLRPRQPGTPPIVVAVAGPSGIDYLLAWLALHRM